MGVECTSKAILATTPRSPLTPIASVILCGK